MKKITLLFIPFLLFFPSLSVAVGGNFYDNTNNDKRALLLSEISHLDIKSIVTKIVNAYLNKQTIIEFDDNLKSEEAKIIQEEVINILSSSQGKIIGYKAALTNPRSQKKFNVNQPLLGILLEKMLLPSGSTISPNFGAQPMIEGDLMVRVSSEKINEATTPQETLKYLDAVIPFLELPDLVYDENIKVNGAMLTAINVGARFGIVGDFIKLNQQTATTNSLKNISVTLRDESGKIIGQGNSNTLLGDPLNVVFWIKEELKTQDKTLKKGDLLSLGSITPLIPIETQKMITAQYTSLENDEVRKIMVSFEQINQ